MDSEKDKRKRISDDEETRRQKKSKRPRSKSRSPANTREEDSRRKRRYSRSRSPEKSAKKERQQPNNSDAKKEAPQKKNTEDMLNTRTGGAYIPPARLRMMQAQITDKSSVAYQRLAWEALKKSIHGHINKINVGNIGIIIKQLLRENIVRGRGLLCRSVIQAQAASPTFTNVYAALVAAVNSRFPNIGELLLKRLVIQFKRGFKRNDKPICISSASFIAHLVNQRVAHEILALELLTLLVETPTDDSVEVAISFLKECGQKLTEVSSKGVNAIFEMLRNILHEGRLDKRVQYMIEVMFQVWKDGFKDHPALIEELELVPEEEQFTHLLMLDDATDSQDILNVFKFDEKFEDNEQKYKTLSKEILGSDDDSDEEDGEDGSGSEESDEEDEQQEEKSGGVTIIDNTETNLVALRRTIYLTINSSLDFEECAHKLMKLQLKPGQEVELCHMFLDCCAEQRTYEKFYGLLAQRFCNINRMYIGPFEEIFKDSYSTAHRLDTNRLRNVSKFFAHLLFTDSISWEVLECVRLNEEDTTSSSRIYIKILFQELAEYMGLKKLNDRLKDPTLQGAFSGIFPRDNPKNTRFSINFFTSIGLGGLTDELREHLKQLPKNVPPPVTEIKVDSDSTSSSSSSSDSSSESSSSDSAEDKTKSKQKKKKTKSKDNNEQETASKNVAENEKWGHDGFYDNYGKEARRFEPERNKRDKDNFFIPRDVGRKPEQRQDRPERGSESREDRGNDRRYEREERSGRDYERRDGREDRSDKREDRTDRREDRRDRGEDKRDRGEDRRERGEDRRDRGEDRRERGEDRENRDERRVRNDDRTNIDDRDIREDRRDRKEDRDRNRDEGDRRENRERTRDEKGDRKEERTNEDRDKREDWRDRKEKEKNRDNRDKGEDRRERGEDTRYRGERRDRNEDRTNIVDLDQREDRRDRNEDKQKKRYEREGRHKERDNNDDPDKKSPRDLESRSRQDDKQDKLSKRDDSIRRRDDKKAKDTGYESDEDEKDSRRHRERTKRDKYEKENRKTSKEHSSKHDDRRNNDDSDSDDGRYKRKYDKRTGIDMDQWDIRGSSLVRETQGRYWDLK